MSEPVLMTLCGWNTASVFRRHRIVNEQDLAEGLAKLASASSAEAAPKFCPDANGHRTGTKGSKVTTLPASKG